MVDAWQIEQRLQSRPLKRGDWVLQVIATDSPWTVEANVPQSRVDHLHTADEGHKLSVSVSLDSDPTQTFVASLERLGPAIAGDATSPSSTAVLLRLSDQASITLAEKQMSSDQSGAPARAMFHCGTAPTAVVLFQDMIRSVRRTGALYFGGQEQDET